MWIISIILGLIVIVCLFFVLELKGFINVHYLFNKEKYTNQKLDLISENEKANLFRGLEVTASKKIIFSGICRDNEKTIQRVIDNLSSIGEKFLDYRIILFENDSKDKTREIIKRNESKNVVLLQCKESPDCKLSSIKSYASGLLSEDRFQKLANYRNRYLSEVYSKYRDWDYLMIFDCDYSGVFIENGIFHSINLLNSGYSAVFANGKMNFPGSFGMVTLPYDALAFIPISEKERIDELKIVSVKDKKQFYPLVKNFFKQGLSIKGYSPIDVISAFNGAAIYKISDVMDTYYTSQYSCEHNSLNIELFRKSKKLCVNPEFKIYVGRQGHA